ncbi:hypothetical protein ASF70_15815 [Rhizobium sp. Leaf321]|uniref:hypothetical protein n=1 Tax=Rhizobium sp. Leaf321 TaxID=1736335 RepID=UPI000715674A|nr:hypothetical protein [Rhizobium sp. Leaf321]KQQ72937.1 hypothetical protein ASF70_15815 [Rhizobium sp. Leaf321]
MALLGTLSGFRAYALARGDNAPTAASDVAATAALMRGSDMIRLRYVANLCGYDITSIPAGSDIPIVEEAAYIAASLELTTPGFFSKTYTGAESKVLTEVKGIKWTVVGKSEGAYAYMPSSSLIDALFGPYMCCGPAIMVV